MEAIINFIENNYLWIITIGSGVLEFILLFIFRRDKLIDNGVWRDVVLAVLDAEDRFGAGNGSLKHEFVFARVIAEHPQVNPNAVNDLIEIVLNTPQRKK